MEEQQSPPPVEEPTEGATSSRQSWQEVGQQFEALGQSLSAAFRAAWDNEQTQRGVQEMKDGLQSMADEVSGAVRQTASTPEAQELRAQATKTAQSARQAGEKAFQDAQPQLVDALRKLNTELDRLVERLQQTPPPAADSDTESSD